MRAAVYNPSRQGARVLPHPASRDVCKRTKLVIPQIDGLRFIAFETIKYLRAEGNYTTIVLASGEEILFAKTLKWTSIKLPQTQFIRVHASYIVALSFIEFLGRKNYCPPR